MLAKNKTKQVLWHNARKAKLSRCALGLSPCSHYVKRKRVRYCLFFFRPKKTRKLFPTNQKESQQQATYLGIWANLITIQPCASSSHRSRTSNSASIALFPDFAPERAEAKQKPIRTGREKEREMKIYGLLVRCLTPSA